MNGSAVSSLTNARGMADPMETPKDNVKESVEATANEETQFEGGNKGEGESVEKPVNPDAEQGDTQVRDEATEQAHTVDFDEELGEDDLLQLDVAEEGKGDLSKEEVLQEGSVHSEEGNKDGLECSSPVEFSSPRMEKVEESSPLTQLKGELNELTDREKQLEPVLQLYEEVIELRREAEALKEDEDRAVRQLATGDVSSLYDGDVERVVGELEAAVENSYLQACWTKERQRYTAKNGTDLPEWWRVNLADLMPRLQDAKRLFERSNGTARDLYRNHEAKVNANTDARDKVKAEMLVEIAGELDQLKQQRERLLVIDKEQRFHLRRGTHVKELQLTAKKQKDALESRAGHEETRQFGAGVRLNDVIHDLKMQIIQLQRELRDVKVSGETTLRLLQSQMQDVTKSGEEVRKARAEYEEENESLMSLKHELQCVLHYVRVRAREANY